MAGGGVWSENKECRHVCEKVKVEEIASSLCFKNEKNSCLVLGSTLRTSSFKKGFGLRLHSLGRKRSAIMTLSLGAVVYTGTDTQQVTSSNRLRMATMLCDARRAPSTTTGTIGFAIDLCASFGTSFSLTSLQS